MTPAQPDVVSMMQMVHIFLKKKKKIHQQINIFVNHCKRCTILPSFFSSFPLVFASLSRWVFGVKSGSVAGGGVALNPRLAGGLKPWGGLSAGGWQINPLRHHARPRVKWWINTRWVECGTLQIPASSPAEDAAASTPVEEHEKIHTWHTLYTCRESIVVMKWF